ncbi:Mpo1-like protein [Rheinheimera sp.]|uniref:Mpo1 family 2-hydroxy fatty acid dioxygenase n=1 Tax=Rheinheimera sp. TaxID=1869214 RepID=UPI00307D758D
MKTVQQWFDEYGESHQNPTNKLIHWLAVPVIYFTVFGLLWQLPMPFTLFAEQQITWPLLLAVPALAFYFSLSFAIGLGMTIFTALVVWLIRVYQAQVSPDIWVLSLTLFVIAWVFQFIGHKIEGKKPSFFKDLQFLLIGPAWLLGFILRRLGLGV